MMRMEMKDPSKRIGPSLCGGLSLLHYKSFHQVSSFQALKVKCEAELSEYLDLGIHVMVSQNQSGTLTIGDSHQYANDFEPFDETYINQFILNYLKSFMMSDDFNLVQSWNGIYAKMQDERSELFLNPSSGVYLLTGVGGAGMTLSFGLAEEVCGKL
jgi:glycine/D-amino acid oxidase-like deaminating enzyme